MIRAFLGIDLPPAVRGALQVQQFLLPMPRKVEPENLHLTLVFLGDCSELVLDAAHEGFGALREPRFSLALQGLGLFGKDKPRVAWAGVVPSPELMHLQAKVETIARRAGCPLDARKFVPHVTLGRFQPPPPPDAMRLERAIAMGQGFRTDPWEITELTLWRSHLTGKGSHYEVLTRYPLA
ncbi:MAG: RNA 2',3'-cyclic phosphodiesterase [Tabrizicola sp.]|uniref:RNA 2',3'-cyclic phosphodiesterase n=1 Tax=Tabrizicola sp. TaxID=2005166 RepID=UPI002ABBCF63|nr:RNA 2',3'-cyclic phosphodiesterase [Tabrizicola sp.]MDZ4089377.1 RNA 2',3'-cyclic phosphodiesterase [Tabrizicola sp.]